MTAHSICGQTQKGRLQSDSFMWSIAETRERTTVWDSHSEEARPLWPYMQFRCTIHIKKKNSWLYVMRCQLYLPKKNCFLSIILKYSCLSTTFGYSTTPWLVTLSYLPAGLLVRFFNLLPLLIAPLHQYFNDGILIHTCTKYIMWNRAII